MMSRGGLKAGTGDLLDALLTTVYPPHCLGCDAALAVRPRCGLCHLCLEVTEPNLGSRCERCDVHVGAHTSLCAPCTKEMPPYVKVRAVYVYGGSLSRAITAAKFSGREDIAADLGTLMGADPEVTSLLSWADTLVPIPLGRRRRRQRGYNQSAIMARSLARAAQGVLPVRHVLKRQRETQAQSGLAQKERRENVAGAFAPRSEIFRAASAEGGRALLVDDVLTSGHTVEEAARVLLKSGWAEVAVVALARAELAD